MITVEATEPFASQFFQKNAQILVQATNLFTLVAALDRQAPGFAHEAALRAAFAINGQIVADWSAPLAEDAQVMIFPRIAGG